MSKADRKRSRRDAIHSDREARDSGTAGIGKRVGFTVSEDELENLGISEYRTSAGEDGAEKLHKIHFLPAHKDDPDLVALKLYAHYQVGPEGASYLCPRWMCKYLRSINVPVPKEIADGRCPACEKHDELLEHYKKVKDDVGQEERDGLWAELKALHPYSGSYRSPNPKRLLAWVVDATSDDTEDEGTKFWMMPVSVYLDGVVELSYDDDETDKDGNPIYVDLLDPDEGSTFLFKRKGEQLTTRYSAYRAKKRKWSITKETDWLDQVPRYFEVLKFAGYDEIATAMGTIPDGEPEDPDDSDEPAPPDDDEEEVLKDDLEDAFEDDKPGTARRRRRNKDEEKEDVEVEEEEEKPRRRKRRVEEDDKEENADAEEENDTEKIKERVRRRMESRRKAKAEETEETDDE